MYNRNIKNITERNEIYRDIWPVQNHNLRTPEGKLRNVSQSLTGETERLVSAWITKLSK